jgi:hypothetical protein
MAGTVTPLRASEIRVWSRPGAVAGWWAFRLVAAWLLVTPLADTLAAPTADLLRGDAVLFDAGGAYLLEALRHAQAQLAAGTRRSLWTLLLVGAASLIPLCAVLVALSHRGRLHTGNFSQLTARHLPAFVMLAGLTLLAQAVVLLGIALVMAAIRDPLYRALTPRSADLGTLAIAAVGVALVVGLGLVQDLARASVVRHDVGGRTALTVALGTLRRRPLRTLLDWLTPAVYTLPVVAAAAVITGWLHVDRSGMWRVGLVFLVHQFAAFGLIALRCWWLARALVLVSDAKRTPDDMRSPAASELKLGRPRLVDRPAGSAE